MSTTTILELGRINSVRVQAEGAEADNKNNWTNTFPSLHIKKGTEIQLDSSIINVRGADSNAIQFDGGQATNTNPINDNECEFEVGFYLNNNGHNSMQLPFTFVKENSGGQSVMSFLPDKTENAGADERIKLDYLAADNREYMNNTGNASDLFMAKLQNCKGLNPFCQLNGQKFAKIDRTYTGWERGYDGNGIPIPSTHKPKLMIERVPVQFDVGFTAPSAIADNMTLAFQQTNQDIYSEDITAVSFHYYKQDAGKAYNPTIRQPRLNGFCFKSIEANMAIYGSNTHHIYGNLCTEAPYLWKYGSQILSNMETYGLQGHPWFNPNTFADGTAQANLQLSYPCIVWNTLIGQSLDPNLTNYSIYSPHREIVVPNGGDNSILTISEATGNFDTFNDVYRNQYENTNNGAYIFKSGSDFLVCRNSNLVLTDDQGVELRCCLFADQTDPNFSNIVGYNRFNAIGGTFNRVTEQLVKIFQNVGEWTSTLGFSPADAYTSTDIEPPNPFKSNCFIASNNMAQGTFGNKFTYKWLNQNIIKDVKYQYKFTTRLLPQSTGGATSALYEHPILVADRTATFGMPGISVTADGDHESPVWTATADNDSVSAFMIGYSKQLPSGQIVEVSNISFLREDTETDETYTIVDDNNAGGGGFLNTNDFKQNKMYSITQNASIGTYNLTLSNNTIPSQGAYVGVDYNRNYKIITRGVLLSFNSGVFQAITTLNGHDPNVALLYNDDDPDYTYWCFQGYSSTTTWTIYRLSKYQGGIPTAGTQIGTIESVGFNVKNLFRNGQQYWNLSTGNGWGDNSKPIYDYASGNDFTNVTPGGYSSLRFFNTPGNAGGNIGAYDGYWANPANLPQRVYYRYNPIGDTTAISGTAYYTLDPVPYQRQWSFDINTGTNGTFTQIFTDGSSATYEPSGALTTTYNPINFTSHITDPLPVIDTDKQYFQSVTINGQLYYLGANNNGNGDDTDKEGLRGRLMYSTDGGATFITNRSWNYDGNAVIDLNGVSNLSLRKLGAGSPDETNVISYPTSQTISEGGVSYSVPSDGRMYGNSYGAFGTTTIAQTTPPTQYLGPGLNSADATGTINIKSGKIYDNLNDDWANDNGKTWSFDDTSGRLSLYYSNGILDSQYLNANGGGGDTFIKQGWVVSRVNKATTFNTNDVLRSIQTNIQTSGITKDTFPTGDGQLRTIVDNAVWDLYDINTNQRGTQVRIQTQDDTAFDETIANIPKHTMLFTNLKFNETNLDYIKDYFRYNEIYNGTEKTRTKIINDTENYYVKMDLNWTDDSGLTATGTTLEDNGTGKEGAVFPYLYHQGQMGKDDSNDGGSESNQGVIYPRMKQTRGTPANYTDQKSKIEQRINIFTRWKDNWTSRGLYENRTGETNLYADILEEREFINNPLYQKCVSENIGAFPFKLHGTEDLFMAFEVYQDYTGETEDDRLFTQQSLQMFGFSPMLLDHSYITPMNGDAPSIKNDDYNFTGRRQDQANNLNIGAVNPTFNFNDSLNKFEISYFHTPVQYNLITGNSDQASDDYFSVMGNEAMFEDWLQYDGFSINDETDDFHLRFRDIVDSQAGIYVNNIYFTKQGQGVEMTKDNYYSSCLWRLGFSYYQWKPLNFAYNSFSNRFNNYSYNNIKDISIRETSCRPFTTNSLTTIAASTSINIITDNSGTQGSKNGNSGTPFYQLGYPNNRPAAVVAVSDKMVAKSLTINMKSPFYRIVCPDLPLDTLIYTAQGGRLNSVGVALLNYSSANMFFYSYASSYNATITRDVTINSLNTQIVDDTGNLVQSLDDRCSITLKIVTPIPAPEEKSPEEEELEDIEEDLEQINETLEGRGAGGGKGGEGEGGAEDEGDKDAFIKLSKMYATPQVQQQVQQLSPQQQLSINQFIENFQIDTIMNLVNRTIVSSTDDNKDIARKISNGLAEFYLNKRVKDLFKKAVGMLDSKGIEETLKEPFIQEFADDINKYYITEDGRAIKGARAIPQILDITPEGAMTIYNDIADAYEKDQDISAGALSAEIIDSVENLFGTQDLKAIESEDVPLAVAKAEEDNAPTEGNFDLDDLYEVEYQERQGIKPEMKQQLTRLFIDYDLQKYLKLYVKMDRQDIEEVLRSKNIDEINDYFKEVKKFILKDNPFGITQNIRYMNDVLKVDLGEKYDNYSALLENYTNTEGLTGTKKAVERKRQRRTRDETKEGREMGREDKRGEMMNKAFLLNLFEKGEKTLRKILKSSITPKIIETFEKYKADVKAGKNVKPPHIAFRDAMVASGKYKSIYDFNKGNISKKKGGPTPDYKKFNDLRIAFQQEGGKPYGRKASQYVSVGGKKIKNYKSPVGFEKDKPEKRGRGRPRKVKTGGGSPVRKMDINTFMGGAGKDDDVETKKDKR